MIYFTSDLHFGHQKSFLFEPRGFESIEEHDKAIVKNWNNVVTPEDEVYILGDLMLNDNEHGIKLLEKLNGKKYVIGGNHDSYIRINQYLNAGLDYLGFAYLLKYKKFHFYLSHYPTITSNFDLNKPLKQRVINLCGHSHTKEKFGDWDRYNSPIYHVELDAHNCCPVSIEDIIKDIKEKHNNGGF